MAQVLESLRAHNKSDLIDLVKMHLAFCIEVEPAEWQQICEHVDKEEEEAERAASKLQGKGSQTKYFTSTNSSTSTESCKVNSKFAPPKEKELASNIFGNPLSPASLRQAMILVDFLNEEENYKLEGIFRKSGTQERQQDLRFMLNNGVKVDLKANRFTPVDVSCVLKEFVQKLPEPLLTTNHFESHFELAKTIRLDVAPEDLEVKNAKRLKIIQLLLHLLPELNRNFFMSLMALLNRVAKSVDVTCMDERSLATIFCQHILCPRSWTPKQVQRNIEHITDAMEFLLLNYEKLFTGPTELVLDAREKLKKYVRQKKTGDQHQLTPGMQLNSQGDTLDGQKVRDGGQSGDSDNEAGDENNTVITFCQRKPPQDTVTETALAELYAQVQAMPETPHKRKLIKQFNKQNGFGTPMHVTSKTTSSSKWRNLLPPILRPKH